MPGQLLKTTQIICAQFLLVSAGLLVVLWARLAPLPASALAEVIRQPTAVGVIVGAVAALGALFVVPAIVERSALRAKGPGADLASFQQAKLMGCLVAVALADAVAVLGFVGGLTLRSFPFAIPFFLVAVLAFSVHWPTQERWTP